MTPEALLHPASATEISLEEWYALAEDQPGEVVEGHLEEEEVPDYVHEFLLMLLGQVFANWVVPRGGALGGPDAKLVVGERRGRKPDLTVYLPGSAFPPRRGLIRVPPHIAVEILELGPDRRYIHSLGATSGVIDPVPGCEGLTLDLDAVWAAVDRLPAEDGPSEGS